MSYECGEAPAFVSGLVIGAGLILGFACYNSSSTELECREGKLYEVSHEGNITIYDPTFDDCETSNPN